MTPDILIIIILDTIIKFPPFSAVIIAFSVLDILLKSLINVIKISSCYGVMVLCSVKSFGVMLS